MADSDEVILKLFLDATRFEGGLNQAQRALDKLGVVVDGSTQKLEVLATAAGTSTAKFTALTEHGDKVTVSFEKVGNSFQVTSAKIATAAGETVKHIDKVAQAAEAAAAAHAKAEAAIAKQLADRKAFEEKAEAELSANIIKINAAKYTELKKQIADRAIFERDTRARLQADFAAQDAANLTSSLGQAQAPPAGPNVNKQAQAKQLQAELQGIRNRGDEDSLAEKNIAIFAKEAKQREAWAAAVIKAEQDVIKAEIDAHKINEDLRKADAAAILKQGEIRFKFELDAEKKLKGIFEQEAADRQSAKDKELQDTIDANKKIDDELAKSLQRQFAQEASDRKKKFADIDKQHKDRLQAEEQLAKNLQKQFAADAAAEKKKFADIDRQHKERLKFEEKTQKELTDTFKKESDKRAKLAQDAAKADFAAFAQAAAEKQKLAEKQAGRPGFFSSLNQRVNPFASQSSGAFLGTFTGNLAARGVSAAGGALKEGFEEAISFEQSLSRLQVVQRGTKLTTEQLSRSVLDLSNSFNIDRNDVVAAKLTVFQNTLAQSDVEANKVVASGAKLAKLTGSTLNDSVETITTSINAFGLSLTDADKVSELLFKTFKNGGPPIRETATVFGQIGALIAPFGAKIEDVSAILAAFNKRGLSANETLTTITNIFTRLANPLNDKGLKDFLGGLSLEEIISSKGTIGLLQSLADKAKSGASELAELFAQGKSGKSGVAVLGAITDIVEQEKILKENTHQASEALKELQENAGEKLANSINQSKNAFLELGQGLLNTQLFKDIAAAMKVAAESAKRGTSDFNDQAKAADEETERLRELLNALKSLKTIGKIAPEIDISKININELRGFKSGKPGNRDRLGQLIVNNGLATNPLTQEQTDDLEKDLDQTQVTFIAEEQERRRLKAEAAEEEIASQKNVTKANQLNLEQQSRAAFTAFDERLSKHRQYVESVIEQEKSITKHINNELEIQVNRAEEGVRRIEEVAKKSADTKKKLSEDRQTRKDQFDTTQFAAQQKLTNPRQREFNEQFRQDQLKVNAEALLNKFTSQTGSDFLESKNLDIAKQKLAEFVKLRQDARDAAIEEFKQGHITQGQLLQKEGEYIDALRTEDELLQKTADRLKEKELATKKIADAQKLLVEDVKKDVSEVINFNPFVNKDKQAGNRGIAGGSIEDQLKRFDTIAERIKANEKNLTLDQVINVDSKIKERRDQLIRELNLEKGEKAITEKGAEFRAAFDANAKGAPVGTGPGTQQAVNEGLKAGLGAFGNGLQTSSETTAAKFAAKEQSIETLRAKAEGGGLTGQALRDAQNNLDQAIKQRNTNPQALETIPQKLEQFGGSIVSVTKVIQGLDVVIQELSANTGIRLPDKIDFKKKGFNPNIGLLPKQFKEDGANTTNIGKIEITVNEAESNPEDISDKISKQIIKDARRGKYRSTNFGE